MKARAPRILMPGTALEGRGGVAALVAVLRTGGLFEQHRVRHVSIHREGSLLARLGAAASRFRQAVGSCLWRRPAVVHAHAASHASSARKSLLLWLARCAACQAIVQLQGGGFRQFATVRSSALMRRWIRHTLERSSLVIALSDGRAGFVRGFAPRARVTMGPNAVALPPTVLHRTEPGRALFLGRVEAAKGVAEDAGLRERLGDSARARVAQHYSTQAVCGRLAAIYNELAGAR